MAPGAIVLALSNPHPEIHPDVAARYAAVVATGRSDFPNQINNVLAFPGVFRGALDGGAHHITEAMKLAAAEAIAAVAAPGPGCGPHRAQPARPAGGARRGRRRRCRCRPRAAPRPPVAQHAGKVTIRGDNGRIRAGARCVRVAGSGYCSAILTAGRRGA